MPLDLPRTEAELRQRRTDALRRMRTAERIAYFQGAVVILLYLSLAQQSDWLSSAYYLMMGCGLPGLGWAVGRRHRADAAAVLVVIVLGIIILQFVAGAPTLSVLAAIFAWKYGQAFNAAREYATLAGLQFESAPPEQPGT